MQGLFLTIKLMKKIIFLSAFFLLLTWPIASLAQSVSVEQNIVVAKDEVINDNFVRFGQNITIDGQVNGDVRVAGYNITVNGDVAGDVLAAGQVIKIKGKVAGHVRVAATTVEIDSPVGKNVNVLANTLTLGKDSSVGWSLAFAAMSADIRGPVAGNIYGWGNSIAIANSVGTDVNLKLNQAGQLTLEKGVLIKGNLKYMADQTAVIKSGAQVLGKTERQLLPAEVNKAKQFISASWIFFKIISLFSLLLIGMIIVSLLPDKTRQITQVMWQKPWKTILLGLVYFIVAPIALFILLFTIIGIPLSIIGFCLYSILIYTLRIFTGTLLGQKILEYFNKKKLEPEKRERNLLWPMILGTVIIFILISLPYIGWIMGLIATLWAFGGLGEILKKRKEA